MLLELSDNLRRELPDGTAPFNWFLHGSGTVHREVKNRLTYEARLGELHFYVKRHLGCGWKEVLKEWYRLRKPVVSARTEWEGAEALAAAGVRVPRVLGKGERGRYPHAVESFVALEALENCETLEHFQPGWMRYDGTRWVHLKHALIDEVASAAARMHGKGINHRDFYLNHFLVNRDFIESWQPGIAVPLHLIDLHRVQQRTSVPSRWLLKDLAALLFSALNAGLTSTDCARFLRIYLGAGWKNKVRADAAFWKKVIQKAIQLYRGFYGNEPTLPHLLRAHR